MFKKPVVVRFGLGLAPIALLALLIAGGAVTHAVDPGGELRLAARTGDLAAVKRLVASDVPVDASDSWGTTPLYLAAGQGQVAVVRYLLDHGADPSAREGFFGSSVLGSSLRGGEPPYEIARMLLAAGAEDRAMALGFALDQGDLELARAAAASGAFTETEATELRKRYSEEHRELLGGLKTRPDPPPPSYSAADLAKFAGRFEGAGDVKVTFAVRDGALVADYEGQLIKLTTTGDRTFRNAESDITVRYFGRAGTVEGLSFTRADAEPLRMGLGDDPTVATVKPSDYVAKSKTSKTKNDAAPVVHWPGFRGANRDGIGDGAEPPVTFDLETGSGVAWRAPLPGLGNSSPVIWGDRVYVTTAVAAGGSTPLRVGLTGAGDEIDDDSEHRWLLLAFDKTTGKQLWETEVGRAKPLTKRHFKATQANSTPITDGEHIVVVFPTAGLACVGKDGAIHWQHKLGGLNAGGFNDPGMQWGFAASPILHDGKVILQVDIHEGPYIAAWDLKTGKPLWRTERPDVAPSWSTPAIWPTPDGDELVVNASVIRSYNPSTGAELWSLGPTSIQVVAAPIVGETNLIVSSGYPPARPIYAVKPGIRGKHTIEGDADAGALAWYQTRGGAYMPTPLLYRGLLYMVNHRGRMVVHDAQTGARVYQARFSRAGTCTSSPVVANGKIYQGTEEGTLYVLEAGPTYRELAVHEFETPLMATPAISEGTLFVRTPGELIALRTPQATKPKN